MAQTYNITGTVTSGGAPLSDVTVNGGALGNRTTNAMGTFSFLNIPNNTPYALSFSKQGYTFTPPGYTGTISGAHVQANSSATPILYTISGTVTNADTGAPVSGVSVQGGPLGNRTTNASGQYSFNNISSGTEFSLHVSKNNYRFEPDTLEGTVNFANVVRNTSGVQIATITGRVKLSNLSGTGVEGALVRLGEMEQTTDSNGGFRFEEVLNGSYTLSASKPGYYIEADPGVSPVNVAGADLNNRNLSATPELANPTYSLWNGFLDLVNVLELNNRGASEINATVTLYDISGNVRSQTVWPIPGNGQRDLIVNDLPGFMRNSYGIVKVEFSSMKFDGRMSFYRLSPDASFYEFAFAVPFSNPLQGKSFVTFNTFQPSAAYDEGFNVVTNWLSVVNLDPLEEKVFTLKRYDQEGNLLFQEQGAVPPFGRVDVDGGHGDPGPWEFGLNEIIPEDPTSPYLMQLVRYGTNSESGGSENGYSFAFPLIGQAGNGREQFVPISRGAGGFDFVEIANTLDQLINVRVEFYSTTGLLITNPIEVELEPHAQIHLDAATPLMEGASGYARIIPDQPDAIIGQSMVYFYDSITGGITSIYGSPIRETFGRRIQGSYNLFLGMYNWLKVMNVTDQLTQVTLRIPGPTGEVSHILPLPPRGGLELGLHETGTYGTMINNYGPVILEYPKNGSVFSELLRVKPNAQSYVDFSVPTLVR